MLTLSMVVRNSLIFLIIGFTYAVNGLGVSSKLDFDDSESASKLNSNGNHQVGFKIAKSLNDPFTDSIIKLNKDQISDISCRGDECEFTVKPIKKDNGNDQVVTKVNVKVETKLKKDDEDSNNNKKTKNITVSDVPIFRGKPDSVMHHYYYTKRPISPTNIPNFRGHSSTPRPQSRRIYPQNSVYSITPKPVFIPLTNPTFSTVTFDQTYLPNSMWITRNINGNSKTFRTDFIVPNGVDQWAGTSNTNYYRPLVATDQTNPSLNQWFYPATQLTGSNIPKKMNDLNKYYNNVRFYLENSFPPVNYPGNVQVQHKGDDCNCEVTKSNPASDNFYRALHTGNNKKTVTALDDKLDELDS